LTYGARRIGERVAATIHYLKQHYRGSTARPPAPQVAYHPKRRAALFELGMLVIVLVLVVIGVWLISGVASVGRVQDDCLQSARRVCGLFSHQQ
jgi:hypothetical protein